jgi:hypothetical protein
MRTRARVAAAAFDQEAGGQMGRQVGAYVHRHTLRRRQE